MNSFKERYGLQFWLLCLSSFLFFMSFNMIVPELPDYLERLGGREYLGLFISLFTLAALISRPFSGTIADKVGRIPVMIFGSVVCVVCGILYPILSTVGGFLFIRFIHGFSTGFKPTGTSAFVADITAFNYRGEAMGYLGFFATMGAALGNGVGSPIANAYSTDMLFYISSVLAAGSVLVLIGMKETLQHRERFGVKHLLLKKDQIFEPKVLPAFWVMIFSYFPFGVILTIVPDFSEHIGYENKGLFFMCVTISSLFVRILAGKASDKFGRVAVLKVCYLLLTLSLVYLGTVDTKTEYIIAAILLGLPFGMNYPTIFAWTIDLSDEKYRGKAMATVYIALELTIGTGAIVSAWIYQNNPMNFPATFWSGAAIASFAFFYLIYYSSKQKRQPD